MSRCFASRRTAGHHRQWCDGTGLSETALAGAAPGLLVRVSRRLWNDAVWRNDASTRRDLCEVWGLGPFGVAQVLLGPHSGAKPESKIVPHYWTLPHESEGCTNCTPGVQKLHSRYAKNDMMVCKKRTLSREEDEVHRSPPGTSLLLSARLKI
jgi:hypothetical protein